VAFPLEARREDRMQDATPTPQRKRRRHQPGYTAEEDSEGIDVMFVSETPPRLTETVPCEICGADVAFDMFLQHMSTHNQHPEAERAFSQNVEQISCEVCGELIPFNAFAEHMQRHGSSGSSCAPRQRDLKECEVCGAVLDSEDMEDHLAAHRVHQELLDAELQSSTSEVDIAAQIVEMARSGGSGLPGNRSTAGVGDMVLVRWADGHWYPARILQTYEDGRHQVGWDPPYTQWSAESVAPESVIPRMNQPREVCNFDVAVAFVRRLRSIKSTPITAETDLEVVYHWTREENVNKIVENNLRPPGSTNADGSAVRVLNGEVYGRGIYASTNIDFARSFGGGLACAFLCIAFPGRMAASPLPSSRGKRKYRAPQPAGLEDGQDCYRHGDVRVYRCSEQVLPLFFTDKTHQPKLVTCAQSILGALETRVLGLPPRTWKEGQQVEVLWEGNYWKAQISQVHVDAVSVKWHPPFHVWPAYRAAHSDLRNCA